MPVDVLHFEHNVADGRVQVVLGVFLQPLSGARFKRPLTANLLEGVGVLLIIEAKSIKKHDERSH